MILSTQQRVVGVRSDSPVYTAAANNYYRLYYRITFANIDLYLVDTKQPPLSTDTSVYRNPWSPRELSTNIKEMGEEVTFDQAVTPPEDLRLNYRGLAIVNHLRENNASRSRYLEQLEISLGNSRRHCNSPEAVMNDVLGDGNCAYRAIVLGLEQLELSNTPASERQSVSIMNDNDEVLDVVRSMKNSMFDTMMLAVTGVDLAIDGDHAAECRLLTLLLLLLLSSH